MKCPYDPTVYLHLFLIIKTLTGQEKSKRTDLSWLMLKKQAKGHLPHPNSRASIQQLLLNRVKWILKAATKDTATAFMGSEAG